MGAVNHNGVGNSSGGRLLLSEFGRGADPPATVAATRGVDSPQGRNPVLGDGVQKPGRFADALRVVSNWER